MFNIDCTIQKAGATDMFGQRRPGELIRERCAIVRLRHDMQHTTVRADSSASRAHADHFTTSNRILLPARTRCEMGDKLTVAGVAIRVMSIFPQHDVSGRLDHFEVSGDVWS
jgi:hypothetical protein